MPSYKQTPIEFYYRLYVKESFILSNLRLPELWNTQSDPEFKLNASCINTLIGRGFEKGIHFTEFKKGTNHGKSLEKQFMDLSTSRSDKLLHDFTKLLKIKSFDEFEADKQLTETFKTKYEDELYVNEEFDSRYIYYFWSGQTVEKAKILCKWNGKNKVEKGNFSLCDYNRITNKWELPTTAIDKQELYTHYQGTNLYLTFVANPSITIILHSNDTIFSNKKFILSTYTTTVHETPVSGVALMQKIDRNEVKLRFEEPVPPEIYNLLFQRRCFLSYNEQNYISKHSDTCYPRQTSFSEGSPGDHLPGVYEGYFLDKQFENTTALRVQLMEINLSGHVRFLNEGKLSEGFCSLAGEGELLYITSDFKINLAGMPRVQIIAEVPKKDFEFMEGGCSGYTVTNKPYLGQILFRKISDVETIEQAHNKGYWSTEITYENQDNPQFRGYITPQLLKFFYDERFYSAPDICFKTEFLNKYNKSNEKYNGPKGFFYVYSTSIFQWHIIRYPLLIEDTGEVQLKDEHQNIHIGTAIIFLQNYLIINFNDFKKDVIASNGQYIFYIFDNQIKRFASGISTRINKKNNPQAKREFLIRYPFDEYKQARKNPIPRIIFNRAENRVFNKESQEYKEVKDYYKHIDTLFGREYNLMVISTDATKEERVFKREPFEEIYLNEAIFSFIKGVKLYKTSAKFPSDTVHKIKHYLTLAIQHGFFEEDGILLFIEEYCENINWNDVQIKEYFKLLFDDINKERSLKATK